MRLNEGEKIIRILKPNPASAWFLLAGVLLGPAVLFFGRDPGGHPAKWVALGLICLALLAHRLGLKYTLTNQRLTAGQWWGYGPVESLSLKNAGIAEVHQSFTARLVGCGHVWVGGNGAPGERSISILGQSHPAALAEEIDRLAAEARA